MRKHILFLALLSLALGLKAQTFQFTTQAGDVIGDTLKLNISTGDSRTDFIHFENISTENKAVKVYLEKTAIADEASLFMCFNGYCLLDTISPTTINLVPNVLFIEFDLLYMYSSNMTSVARVHLIDATTMQSLQSFVVAYKDIETSLDKPLRTNVKATSLEVYPNPANYNTTINYTLASNYSSGKIIIRNMIGQELKSIPISGGSSAKQVVSTSDLPNGVYFYSIVGDGKTISTKKLIVKH